MQKDNDLSRKALIFNIQRFSIHDGPGIRTTVFFKGCSLRCFWCHNPEGGLGRPEIQFFSERCIACGDCVQACQQNAHSLVEQGHRYDRDRCRSCGACVATCYANALEISGRYLTVEQVMEEILRDRLFYETSRGGITLSGGEPVLQGDFAGAILTRCKALGLHTAIETCGNYQWQALAALLPGIDLVMMDLKQLNSDQHKKVTGVGNERILANARQLALTDKPILFRTPVVPTVNDNADDLGAIVEFVHELVALRARHGDGKSQPANIRLELLPFHRLASDKYRSLGQDYRAANLVPLPKERMLELLYGAKIGALNDLIIFNH